MGKDSVVSVRLTDEETKRIDKHSQGRLSRSQIIRALVEDFLAKPEPKQRRFLIQHFFGD